MASRESIILLPLSVTRTPNLWTKPHQMKESPMTRDFSHYSMGWYDFYSLTHTVYALILNKNMNLIVMNYDITL